MDYNKVNKIDTDGSGNIMLQDISGSTITVNYNDTEAIAQLFEKISSEQAYELKQLIGSQNRTIVEEIRKLQDKFDKQFVEKQAVELTKDMDDFFKELNQIKIEGLKKRLIDNYQMLREFEELLMFDENPMIKKRYQHQIKGIKENIEEAEKELKAIR